ncbi:polysaccharide deacetylase family protein [Oleiphilus messinensis]|uniref:polysaccharide deacetylase family protein n=1 Tax=Oleiphilus messinensis TaxID=141451 RepID=UPI0012F71CF2|nr:polysaccharide deacetylase family protein [Oleiphilus messinensis]
MQHRTNVRLQTRNVLVLLVLFLAGCSTVTHHRVSSEIATWEIYRKTDNMMLVWTRPGDTPLTLAKRYYGSERFADRIRKYNPGLSAVGKSLVMVPQSNGNHFGIYSNGYQLVPILCYHQFTNGSVPRNRLEVSAKQLDAQLKFLQKEQFTVLSLRQLVAYLEGRAEIPEKSVVITVDDGFRSVYDVAFPLFQQYQFPVTVFIYTDFIGGAAALSWEQMKIMKHSGIVDIQSHSKSHASLAEFTFQNSSPPHLESEIMDFVKQEVFAPEALIEKKLGGAGGYIFVPLW